MKKLFPLSIIFISSIFFFATGEKIVFAVAPQGISDSTMTSHMKKYSVALDDFGRQDFYSWTTPDQIDGLKNGDDFLSRSESPTNGKALYDIILSDTAFDKFPMATILRREQFAKKRFAWVDGWATIMGWEGENYGNQLLKIHLKDSAIIVAFLPYQCAVNVNKGKYFSYSDVKGKPLTEEFALAHTNRIAAIYFCADKNGSRTEVIGSYGKGKKYSDIKIRYREYVICNEQMIDTWESGTENVLSEIKNEKKFLNELGSYAMQKKINQMVYYSGSSCWEKSPADKSAYPINVYDYTIALPNDFYLLNPKCISAISNMLSVALAAHKAAISHTVQ